MRFGSRSPIFRLAPMLRLAVAACAILVSGACAGVQTAQEPAAESAVEWPLGSDGARVVWVKNISDFKEFGSGKGLWGRAVELLAGREQTQGIVRPYGVLHDASGRLYLADPGGRVVHCLDLTKQQHWVIGGQDSALVSPIGLTVDDKDRLYITDSATGVVYRYDPEQRSLKPFLSRKLGRPTGIAFNPVNNLIYISDTLESQIVVVDKNGVERRRLGKPGDGGYGLNRPTDIAVNRTGEILVTDSLNFRITVLTPEGQVARQFGAVGDADGFFSRPKGIGVDSGGHVYVCDALRDAVQVFAADGTPLLVFGRGGNSRGRFMMPSGLYIDRSDNIFVADTYNKRIQVFRYSTGQDLR